MLEGSEKQGLETMVLLYIMKGVRFPTLIEMQHILRSWRIASESEICGVPPLSRYYFLTCRRCSDRIEKFVNYIPDDATGGNVMKEKCVINSTTDWKGKRNG